MTWFSYGELGREDRQPPTEDAVARRFAEIEAGRLRYCHDASAWFHWDGAVWRRDRTGVALHRAREIARELGTDPGGMVSGPAGRTHFVAGVERFARTDPALAVTARDWDADPFLLGTPESPIALKTGQPTAADPRDGISKATAVAPADEADCPLWRRFLDETFGDPALARFVQQFVGYALTGAVNEQVMLFGWGSGGNGKSVLLNTIVGIMGDYARPAAIETVMTGGHPADLAALAGARLVAVTETGRAWAERRLKLLTGGDPVVARSMRRGSFSFAPTFKLVVFGNHPPVLRTVEEAVRRRFCVVPFARRPAWPDRDLEAKLRDEWPAILRWMIEGCLEWQANGLVRPACLVEATADYLGAQDVIGQFLEEACDCEPGNPRRTATAGALFAAWGAFAEAAGEAVGSQRAFADALQERGFRRDRTDGMRFYRGLSLRRGGSPDTGHDA